MENSKMRAFRGGFSELLLMAKYAAVGASGTLLGLAILYLLTSILGINYLISNVGAFALSVSSNYLWNSKWTFKQPMKPLGYIEYVLASLTTFGIQELLLWLLTSLGLYYILSSMAGTLVAFGVNYTAGRKIVWNEGLNNRWMWLLRRARM